MASEGNLQSVADSGGYSAGSLEEIWYVGKKGSWVVEGFDCHRATNKEEKCVGTFHYFRGNSQKDLKTFVLLKQTDSSLHLFGHAIMS